MKRKLSILVLSLMMLSFLCTSFSGCKKEDDLITLYVYNWGEYISDGSDDTLDVNERFEIYCKKELGLNVKVNYSTYSSNESMYDKVKSGAVAYDIVIPSDYMIERMIEDDLLAPLDMSLIPNYANISEEFKGDNVYYEGDSDEIYSVPYFYGMVGIIYNTRYVAEDEESLGSWDLMWDEDYADDILQFNNCRDAFGTALYKLGYSVNEATEEQWQEALDLLIEQKAVIQGYVMDEIFNKMKSGSAAIAAYYAGDYLSMYEDNPDLAFFYPKEGTNRYVDAMCVPANSQNKELAMRYINFMCETEIAVANAEYTYYASPLTSVIEDEGYQETMAEVHEDAMEILYGEMASSVPTEPYMNLEPEELQKLYSMWEKLKMESSVGTGIYLLCGLIVAALLALLTYHILKKRRWGKLYD